MGRAIEADGEGAFVGEHTEYSISGNSSRRCAERLCGYGYVFFIFSFFMFLSSSHT